MEKDIIGIPPDMGEYDKVDDHQLEDAFSEFTKGMSKETLEGEIQVLYADSSPIEGIDVLFYIVNNSVNVANTHSIVGYAEEGYTNLILVAGDDCQAFLTKIDNIDEYIYE